MRVAIASDIHGNRQAFEAVIAAAAADGAEQLWCLGDVVGYGAEPDACAALAAAHCTLCLAGNHDLAVAGALSMADFSDAAAQAARWTQATIGDATRTFLAALSPTARAGGLGLFHASPRDPVWEYVLSDDVAEGCLDASPFRVSLIGHTHVALAFRRRAGAPAHGDLRPGETREELGDDEWLLNPGSAGQPRDGDPRAAWLALDTSTGTATWRREPYDVAGAQAAIRAAGLPDSLADRLATGH